MRLSHADFLKQKAEREALRAAHQAKVDRRRARRPRTLREEAALGRAQAQALYDARNPQAKRVQMRQRGKGVRAGSAMSGDGTADIEHTLLDTAPKLFAPSLKGIGKRRGGDPVGSRYSRSQIERLQARGVKGL